MPKLLLGGVALLLVAGTPGGATVRTAPAFGHVVPVTIQGYHGDAMEPFVSPDGKYLFFNNRNDPATNTDLFFARRVNDTTFSFGGAIRGANGPALDAVASMDAAGNFFFVSTRSYATTFSTIYRGTFANGTVSHVAIVRGVSKALAGWVNFDSAVSADGKTMYFVDGRFDQTGQPLTADLVMARKTKAGFERLPNSAQLLANVNTDSLEYGAAISKDGLRLFFTRAATPLGSSLPAIYVATRSSPTSAFNPPSRLTGLTGFVEAPTLSSNGRAIYFHKLVGTKFVLYRAS